MNKNISSAMEDLERHILSDMDARTASMKTMQYDDILNLVTSESELTVNKMTNFFQEKFLQESKHRVGFEARMRKNFDDHEEWLQQLEGEYGSWHDTATSNSVRLKDIQESVGKIDKFYTESEEKFKDLMANINNMKQSSTGTPRKHVKQSEKNNKESNSSPSSPSGMTIDQLGKVSQQLQNQVKQLQAESKAQFECLNEHVTMMEYWINGKASKEDAEDMKKKLLGLKLIVEKLVRDNGSAEQLLQQYVR